MIYRIQLEDHGQDFLIWDVNEDGKVIGCSPFQAWLWTKYTILNPLNSLGPGDELDIYREGDSPFTLAYPVEKIERIDAAQVA